MLEIALFVEDYAHRQFVGSLVERLAGERKLPARLDWRSAVRGHGMVGREFGRYLRDLEQQGAVPPDLVVVATDANCKGRNERLSVCLEMAVRSRNLPLGAGNVLLARAWKPRKTRSLFRHSRESGNPELPHYTRRTKCLARTFWIPAFAGMTKGGEWVNNRAGLAATPWARWPPVSMCDIRIDRKSNDYNDIFRDRH